jgi:hypothetical protein
MGGMPGDRGDGPFLVPSKPFGSLFTQNGWLIKWGRTAVAGYS